MALRDEGGSIGQALTQIGSVVDHPGPALWHLKLAAVDDGPTTARLTDGWLHLEARTSQTTAGADELMAINAGLPWPARFVLDPSNRRLVLRADVVLSGGVISRRVQEAAAGLAAAMHALRVRNLRPTAPPPPETPLPDAGGPMADWFVSDGWSITRRDGYLEVDLASGGVGARALISSVADGGVRASVVIARRTSGPTRDGLGLWLLASTALLRAVRPALRAARTGATVVLETGFATPPDETELLEAVAALSVALRQTADEAQALLDRDIATHYLARWADLSATPLTMRGSSSTHTRRRTT